MQGHYNYFNHLIDPAMVHGSEWQKFVVAILLGLGIIFIAKKAAARISTKEAINSSIIPDNSLNLFGFFDFFIESFVRFHDSVLGKEGRKYVPFTGSIFLFILFSNLLGLIPGMPALTTTVWVNVGLAIVVFIHFNALGVKQNGLIGYLKHFCGPVVFLAPLLFPLEILSTILRILTLNLRLYWNISADHVVLDIFTTMLGPVMPVPFYILGTFVSFMQAFIFTTLTMVYILLASQHDDSHAEGGH